MALSTTDCPNSFKILFVSTRLAGVSAATLFAVAVLEVFSGLSAYATVNFAATSLSSLVGSRFRPCFSSSRADLAACFVRVFRSTGGRLGENSIPSSGSTTIVMYSRRRLLTDNSYIHIKKILASGFKITMGGFPYIEGVGGQISENLQSFVETSNTRRARNPISINGLWGEGGLKKITEKTSDVTIINCLLP